MIKVRFLNLSEVGVTLAGVATLTGVGAGALACAVPTEQAASSSSAADTLTAAGTGVITLGNVSLSYASTSDGDEFIRVGETLSLVAPWNDMYWYAGSAVNGGEYGTPPGQGAPPPGYTVNATISFLGPDGSLASTQVLPLTFDANGNGTSDSFTVPSAPHFTVAFTIYDPSNNAYQVTDVENTNFPVFGAYLPNKEVLFDNDGSGATRERVIEGGSLVAGANVTLSYTDWRADRMVNKDSLNLTIGQGESYSRFGNMLVNIQGVLSYNIQAVYSTDGGNTWSNPVTLNANADSDALNDAPGRTAYETTLTLPNGASDFRVAFQIQAILTANPNYQYVNNWYDSPNGAPYQLGAQYTLADVWDNDGAADGYYDFSVTADAGN